MDDRNLLQLLGVRPRNRGDLSGIDLAWHGSTS